MWLVGTSRMYTLCVVAAGLLAGCASETVNGRLSLSEHIVADDTGSCRGDGPYADVRPGLEVTIYDEADSFHAIGSLNEGRIDGAGLCVFPFQVSRVREALFQDYFVAVREGARCIQAERRLALAELRQPVVLRIPQDVPRQDVPGPSCDPARP